MLGRGHAGRTCWTPTPTCWGHARTPTPTGSPVRAWVPRPPQPRELPPVASDPWVRGPVVGVPAGHWVRGPVVGVPAGQFCGCPDRAVRAEGAVGHPPRLRFGVRRSGSVGHPHQGWHPPRLRFGVRRLQLGGTPTPGLQQPNAHTLDAPRPPPRPLVSDYPYGSKGLPGWWPDRLGRPGVKSQVRSPARGWVSSYQRHGRWRGDAAAMWVSRDWGVQGIYRKVCSWGWQFSRKSRE